jgi:hypothetical protein
VRKVGPGQVVNDHHGEPELHQATSEGRAPEPSWKCRRVLIQHWRIESVQTHAPVARALAIRRRFRHEAAARPTVVLSEHISTAALELLTRR